MRLGELNRQKLYGVEAGRVEWMGLPAVANCAPLSGSIVYGGEADLWSQLSQR